MTEKYFGKYRGTVENNVDPLLKGRILASVADASGLAFTSWCMPCFPAAGLGEGNVAMPPIKAGVWIEFEKGDPDYPIWSGCFLGSAAEVPALSLLSPPGVSSLTMQTKLQNGLTISDVPGPTGGIVIKTAAGASLIVNDTGIYIQNGKGASITLVGPNVTVNNGALTVI